MTLGYWLAAIAFFVFGVVALVRPEAILGIRARMRPVQDELPVPGTRKRKTFGPREVRLCGVALVFIAVVLARNLAMA